MHAFHAEIPTGESRTLATEEPFTFTGRCFNLPTSPGFVGGEIIVSTTEEHSAFDATVGPTNLDFGPSTEQDSRRMWTASRFVGEATFFVTAPGGPYLSGILYRTDNSRYSDRCILGGHIVVEE